MTVFADTSFFVAFMDKRDRNHDEAQRLFNQILKGSISSPYSNDYVMDETVTMVRRRTRRHDLACRVLDTIRKSKYVQYNRVTEREIDGAVKEYIRCGDKDLSFTDWVNVTFMVERGFKHILAFDKHYEQSGLVQLRVKDGKVIGL